MKKRIIYMLLLSIFFLSCKFEKNNNIKHLNNEDEIIINDYYVIENNSDELGNIGLIYINIEYWNGNANLFIGVNDEIMNQSISRYLPDTVRSFDQLPGKGFGPHRIYLEKKALEYLSVYTTSNCNLKIPIGNFKDANTIYTINTIGDKGKFSCVYGNTEDIDEYFENMLKWIRSYNNGAAFKELLSFLTKHADTL